MRPRSYLYVPGDSERKLASAASCVADALIIDLEDAVAPERKPAARRQVAELLADAHGFGGRQVWVRAGSGPDLEPDLAAVAGLAGLHGVVLAKSEGAQSVAAAADVLAANGDDVTVLMPLLESAKAVLHAEKIAGADRVVCLQVGEVDLSAEVGLMPGPDESELMLARSMTVFASVAAGIAPPVGPASTNFTDLELFGESCRRLSRLGFAGRACIHPRQVEALHEALRPSDAELEWARRLVTVYDEATASGVGACTDENGHLVDLAVVRQARRMIEPEGS
jgi:citrate lyase subunit beta/citryl-CoA lyase